ncbi:MAG TPA: putative glycoside hydrolase [Terriglobales bacterium]|nr:putative glycoside hydrolase [Terriglobales bacterium]
MALAGLGWGSPPPGVRLAYFYKPPFDTPAAVVAARSRLVILTHGDEAYLAQLRRAGYRGPLLQYIAANEAEGPGPYPNHAAACDAAYRPYQRTVADRPGVFCRQIHPHERWFLHNRRGERLWSRQRSADGVWRTTYLMNPASPGWRAFLIARLRQYRRLGFDGFFLDNVDLSRAGLLRQPGDRGGVAEFATDDAYRAAEVGYLAALRAAFPHLPLWANLTHDPGQPGGWANYLALLDGVMVEDFGPGWRRRPLDADARAAQWQNVRAALAAGKSVLAVAQGGRGDRARLAFALALYWALQPARGRLYFRYADADDRDYRTLWWYPAYAFQPPPPLGPLTGAGLDWRRPYPGGELQLHLAAATATLPPAWARAWR